MPSFDGQHLKLVVGRARILFTNISEDADGERRRVRGPIWKYNDIDIPPMPPSDPTELWVFAFNMVADNKNALVSDNKKCLQMVADNKSALVADNKNVADNKSAFSMMADNKSAFSMVADNKNAFSMVADNKNVAPAIGLAE